MLKVSEENKHLLNKRFDTKGLLLFEFDSKEKLYLSKYGVFIEAMLFNDITPKEGDEIALTNFAKRYYHWGREPYDSTSNNFKYAICEKLLLNETYYERIKQEEKKLNVRNHLITKYFIHFNIREFANSIEVYHKIGGRTKPGGDDTLRICYDFKLPKLVYDKYVLSLIQHDELNETKVTKTAFATKYQMGREYVLSEEGIKDQINCKIVEIDIKLDVIKKYKKTDHLKYLNIFEYVKKNHSQLLSNYAYR